MAVAPNWAEQLTAIATTIGAVGLTGAIVAAVYAGQQVREARRGRQAQMAAEFIRRWNEDGLVEARRLIDRFQTPMWKPAIHAAHGAGTYPMFEAHAAKMRAAADESSSRVGD